MADPAFGADRCDRSGVDEHEGERLQKVLARVGVGSRRTCEDLIAAGRVTVDGRVAVLGRRVDPDTALIEVDGAPIVPKCDGARFPTETTSIFGAALMSKQIV